MAGCYIIFSAKLNRFYIGAVREDVLLRIRKHNEQYYGANHFTSKASDWELHLFIECRNYSQAVQIERHVKRMKSATFIENLVKYPEIIDRLKRQYMGS